MRYVANAADAAFQDALLALFQLHGQVLEAADAMSADVGLSGARWQVLRVVAREPMTVSQVARRLTLQRQSVQRSVDQLAADGLVELRANRDHQRASLVALSGQGAATLDRLEARRSAWIARALRGFDRERLDVLREALAELSGRLDKATARERSEAAPARSRPGRRLVAA
jgi:DNA-binding MarR family transcriptional regulator